MGHRIIAATPGAARPRRRPDDALGVSCLAASVFYLLLDLLRQLPQFVAISVRSDSRTDRRPRGMRRIVIGREADSPLMAWADAE